MTEKEIKQNLGRGKDLRGRKYGKLTPLYPLKERKGRNVIWHCKCDCGNETDVFGFHLTSGHTITCGCGAAERFSKVGKDKYINIIGQKYGRLTVIERVDDYILANHHYVQLLCQCDCGNITTVLKSNLVRGNTLSCGCIGKSKGEYIIENILNNNNIKFETQKKFQSCKFDSERCARFDFYVNDKYLIEFDGIQHYEYKNNKGWNNKENYEITKIHDEYKNQWCFDNNIPLIRIPYWHLDKLCLEDLLLETSSFIVRKPVEVTSD